jgi:hypothetical protein
MLAGLAGLALLATAAPLWTYAVTLALFGLPHVAVELRYVDQRFGGRLDRALALALGGGLLGIVLLRTAGVVGIGSAGSRAAIEFALGAWLIAALLPRLLVRGPWPALVGVLLLASALWLAAAAPLAALVAFAVLHNLTPVGFLAERLRGPARRRALAWCALAFGLVPIAIATGWLPALLGDLGLEASLAGPPGIGELDEHLGVFVPAAWRGRDFAFDLFAAAALLQCLHYVVVIGVLPRLGGTVEGSPPRCRWPAPRVFAGLVAGSALLLCAGYAADFGSARAVYGIVAAIHAWIEVPVLLLAAASALPRSSVAVAGAQA